jgi:hypothetical protein
VAAGGEDEAATLPPAAACKNGHAGRKACKAAGGAVNKKPFMGDEAGGNSSKLNERTGNFYENKGALRKTCGRASYFYENTGTYPLYPGMLLKTNNLI